MIKTADEYRRAVELVKSGEVSLAAQREAMTEMGLTEEEIETGLAPLEGFLDQVRAKIAVSQELNSHEAEPD